MPCPAAVVGASELLAAANARSDTELAICEMAPRTATPAEAVASDEGENRRSSPLVPEGAATSVTATGLRLRCFPLGTEHLDNMVQGRMPSLQQ